MRHTIKRAVAPLENGFPIRWFVRLWKSRAALAKKIEARQTELRMALIFLALIIIPSGLVTYFSWSAIEYEIFNKMVARGEELEYHVDDKPGIIMKANPQVGDAYRQEFLKGEAEDMGEVLALGDSVSIGLGTYQNCLRIKDWTPLELHVVEHKYYSKLAGNVILEKKAAGESGEMELIEMKPE